MMSIVKILVLIIKAFISCLHESSQALPVSDQRPGQIMTKLYSLVVLYKGDTAAHILKVLDG